MPDLDVISIYLLGVHVGLNATASLIGTRSLNGVKSFRVHVHESDFACGDRDWALTVSVATAIWGLKIEEKIDKLIVDTDTL